MNEELYIDCPYCKGVAQFHPRSDHIYRRGYGPVFHCRPCDAYVGVHKDTVNPKGTPANHSLREWRKKAHSAFDPIWKSGRMTRNEAYKWLSGEVGARDLHIGHSDIVGCRIIVDLCLKKMGT